MTDVEPSSGAAPPLPPTSPDARTEHDGPPADGAGADAAQNGPNPLMDPNRRPKRSRWGNLADSSSAASTTTTGTKKRRKSRWGAEEDKVDLTPEMAAATAAMTPEQRELYFLRLRLQDVTMKLANLHQCIPTDPTQRSPSPTPEYDVAGKRTNTREQRVREKLINERNELLERTIKLNPQFATPSDFKRQKYVAKLMIPQDEPGPYIEGQAPSRPHSYCGMILGPRGLTQKRMQKETNCKIEIRGRGSQKEGRRHKPHPSDNEDLHVLITAENESDLAKCVKMIEQLLQPVNEDNNEHKARQLRELAAINGTLRDEIRCRLCGERGHFVDRCPERTGAAWNPANIRCEVCGERGHPTSDCRSGGSVNTAERSRLKNEYDNFMSELSGKAPTSSNDQPEEPYPAPPPPPAASYGAPPPPPPPSAANNQPWNQQNNFYPPPPPPAAPYGYGNPPYYGGGYDSYYPSGPLPPPHGPSHGHPAAPVPPPPSSHAYPPPPP